MKLNSILIVWRTILSVLTVLIIGSVLYHYYGVNGTYTVRYDFSHAPNLISEFEPTGRAIAREQNTSNGEFYQRIVSDPVYFSAQLPSAYPSADVRIEYQNPEQSIVQLGLQLTDEEQGWNFDYRTLENTFIDKSNLDRIETDDYVLLQRAPQYKSIDDFFAHPPVDSQVGTWQVSSDLPFIDPSYQPQSYGTDADISLQGTHELFVYVKNETLDLVIDYYDTNTTLGADPVSIEAYYLGELLTTSEYLDDGDESDSGSVSTTRTAQLTLDTVTEGVYKLIIRTSDDIVLSRLQSAQHKLVFKTKMKFVSNDSPLTEPPTVYTDADSVTVRALTLQGLGPVQFFDSAINVEKVNEVYPWHNPVWRYLTPIQLAQSDTEVVVDGYLAMSQDAWFDPGFGFRQLTQYTQSDQLDYIIGRTYQEPDRIRSWTDATVTFDLTKMSRTDSSYLYFILSAPGLNETPQGLKVRTIEITAHKEPITVKNIWPRIKAKLHR